MKLKVLKLTVIEPVDPVAQIRTYRTKEDGLEESKVVFIELVNEPVEGAIVCYRQSKRHPLETWMIPSSNIKGAKIQLEEEEEQVEDEPKKPKKVKKASRDSEGSAGSKD